MEETPTENRTFGPVLQKLSDWGAGPNPLVNTPDEDGRVAGFGLGFWHGATAPVTFILSLFKENVHVFEVHNTGKSYLIGFIMGLLTVWGGGGAGAGRRR